MRSAARHCQSRQRRNGSTSKSAIQQALQRARIVDDGGIDFEHGERADALRGHDALAAEVVVALDHNIRRKGTGAGEHRWRAKQAEPAIAKRTAAGPPTSPSRSEARLDRLVKRAQELRGLNRQAPRRPRSHELTRHARPAPTDRWRSTEFSSNRRCLCQQRKERPGPHAVEDCHAGYHGRGRVRSS